MSRSGFAAVLFSMPSYDRLHSAAVRGGLIAAALMVTSVVHCQENDQQRQPSTPPASQTQTKPPEPPSVTVVAPVSLGKEKTVEPDWAQPNCQKPSNHDESDLCVQGRMAEAAEQTVVLNKIQIALSVFGFVALIITIGYSRSATRAAINAARAADQSVKVTSDNAKRELRAYISMNPKQLGGLFAGGVVRVQFFPKNHGQTPAYSVSHIFGMGIFPSRLPEGFEYPEAVHTVRTESAIYPDSEERCWFDFYRPTQPEIDGIAAGNMSFHCWGQTTFRDVFEDKRTVKFCISAEGPNLILAQEQYRVGIRQGFPEWSWSYGNGHNNSN